MTVKSILLATLYFLVIPSVSQAMPAPSIVSVKFGNSATLHCDGSAYKGFPDNQLDVLWQTAEGKKVVQYSHGVYSVGLRFEPRVAFATERIRLGDFSLTVSSIAFSDEDTYECVWSKSRGIEQVLRVVKLNVSVPTFSKNQSVSAGDPASLPCYGRVSKETPDDELFVQWKKGDDLVLQLRTGVFTLGKIYTERASMSLDKIREGDFSLAMSVTGPVDQGVYQCCTDKNRTITSISLSITDYQTKYKVKHGGTFSFSVPKVHVNVLFLKEGTPVPVCNGLVDYAKCKAGYRERMAYKEGTFLMRNVRSSDEGRYTVRERYNDFVIRDVSLSVGPAVPEGIYGLILMASLCLLALVTWKLKFLKKIYAWSLHTFG